MGILSQRHTHWHTCIVLCPGNTPCHLSQQSRTPGAPLILMNSRFSRNCPSPGLWQNKHSGTRLIRLHCHNSYRLLQPLTTRPSQHWRASLLCRAQRKSKSLLQVSRLSPADNNLNDEIAIVFDASNSRHLGSHPGKYWAAGVLSKSKENSSVKTHLI